MGLVIFTCSLAWRAYSKLMILSTWTVVSFPCVCLRSNLLRMGTSLLYVLVFKDGHHPKTAFPSCKCARGGVCSLPHGKLSLADSVATKQPLLFKRSQWLNNMVSRYDNHTYIHTRTQNTTHLQCMTNWPRSCSQLACAQCASNSGQLAARMGTAFSKPV